MGAGGVSAHGEKDPGLADLHERLKRKHGSGKATVAVAHKLAISVFHMLTRNVPYKYRKAQGWKSGKPVENPGR